LLFAGLEVTTGGQRIHEYEQLCQSIQSRGMEPEKFTDYLQCFKYGMPPHGGLAIGLERLAKQLLGLKNVREASLFPRDRTRISP
jgi:nondiscriminating aspartyl-tRNA synthetase